MGCLWSASRRRRRRGGAYACMIINFPIYQGDVFHSILGAAGAACLPPTSYMVEASMDISMHNR